MSASSGEISGGDRYGMNAAFQDVVVEDVPLPVAETWSPALGMLAARGGEDRILSLTPGMSDRDLALRQIDQIADAVIAAQAISRQSEDDATARSRQSA